MMNKVTWVDVLQLVDLHNMSVCAQHLDMGRWTHQLQCKVGNSPPREHVVGVDEQIFKWWTQVIENDSIVTLFWAKPVDNGEFHTSAKSLQYEKFML